MFKSWRLLLVGLTMAGCSGSAQRPSAADLHEGINLLDVSDAKWGSNAAYVKNGRVVYIETRVGVLKPEVYRNDAPDEPANEMDVRFVDQNGLTFYAVRGGDNWIDNAWTPEITKSRTAKIDLDQRAGDFRIAKEGATLLAKQLPDGFKDHVFHLTQFAAMPAPHDDPRMVAKANRISATPPEIDANRNPLDPARADANYAAYNYGGWMWLEGDKFSKGAGCFAWVCGGSHSAVAQWSCNWTGSSCSWTYAIAACNHGTCPYNSNVSYDCYSNGGWYWWPWINGSTAQGVTGGYDGQGGCQTGYNWNSGGWDHLCNDDAAYELWQTKNGSQGSGGGTGGDAFGFTYTGGGFCRGSACGSCSGGDCWACTCSNNQGCGGDWNTPYCP